MKRRLLPRLVEIAMSHSSKDKITNANSSLKKGTKPTSAVEQQRQETDGATTMLPLSTDHQINSQDTGTEGVISVKRYTDLQDEYAKLAKRYRFMHDEFAEMRIELVRLRQEREEAWRRKK
jgi:hypothetical protein